MCRRRKLLVIRELWPPLSFNLSATRVWQAKTQHRRITACGWLCRMLEPAKWKIRGNNCTSFAYVCNWAKTETSLDWSPKCFDWELTNKAWSVLCFDFIVHECCILAQTATIWIPSRFSHRRKTVQKCSNIPKLFRKVSTMTLSKLSFLGFLWSNCMLNVWWKLARLRRHCLSCKRHMFKRHIIFACFTSLESILSSLAPKRCITQQ